MSSPEKRSFEGPSSKITSRILRDGSVILNTSSGAVSIAILIPREQLAFLCFADADAPASAA